MATELGSFQNGIRFNCVDTLYIVQLWMGTHPKGPSLIASSGESLAKWIDDHQSSLGDCLKLYSQLPFLFKVLSVNIALSIQVHPDKVCEWCNRLIDNLLIDILL